MKTTATKNRPPRLHRDRTVSYWSYYTQTWVQHAIHVPAEEFESMSEHDRARVKKHLGYED